jgi:hypothetical protein
VAPATPSVVSQDLSWWMHVVDSAAVLAIVFVPTVNAWILRSL